jgi:hypothetical protein
MKIPAPKQKRSETNEKADPTGIERLRPNLQDEIKTGKTDN